MPTWRAMEEDFKSKGGNLAFEGTSREQRVKAFALGM